MVSVESNNSRFKNVNFVYILILGRGRGYSYIEVARWQDFWGVAPHKGVQFRQNVTSQGCLSKSGTVKHEIFTRMEFWLYSIF